MDKQKLMKLVQLDKELQHYMNQRSLFVSKNYIESEKEKIKTKMRSEETQLMENITDILENETKNLFLYGNCGQYFN